MQRNKKKFYSIIHSIVLQSLKIFTDFKELSFDSMHQKMNKLQKKKTRFRKVTPQTKEKEDLKTKVLDNAGDLCNELYYIYKERYEKEKGSLNKKDAKKIDYTKLGLNDGYYNESEEEEKQTDKKPDKKEPPKKPTKSDVLEFNELIIKKETGMNRELFQKHFSFQIPTE